jgi:hypothetical protein
MDTPPPYPGPDINRTTGIYLAIWLPFPLAFAFVAARFYIRAKINGLGLDDYFMFACMVSNSDGSSQVQYTEAHTSRPHSLALLQ